MFDDILRFHFARNLHNPASLQIAWDRAKNMTLQQIVYSRANLLTVKQSWNHMRGLSDRGKAALTVPRLFTARRTVCGEITVDVAPAGVCSRIWRHNSQPAIVSDPLSYLYTTASRQQINRFGLSGGSDVKTAKLLSRQKNAECCLNPHTHRACHSFKCLSHMLKHQLKAALS